ncbi:hypothetical protein Pfo_026782 [Paulownia fortunei]|nr:hypothetical protein Pfo_026782 [Paulownia fortunei]
MTKYGMNSQSSTSEVSSRPEQTSSANIQESSSLLITNHKLNGHNYLQWSQSVLMYICGKEKDEYLTGEVPILEKSDSQYRTWKTENHMVMSWLINSITAEVGENFLLYKTAHTAQEIWNAARETYSSSENTSELLEIETRLHDLRQDDLSVTQYFNILTCYWQHLDMFEVYSWKCPEDSSLYKTIVEQKRTFKFLLGLNKDLDEVRGRIIGIKPQPTIREAFSEVRWEESRRKVMVVGDSSMTPTMEGSALFTHSSSQQNQDNKLRREGHDANIVKDLVTQKNCEKFKGSLLIGSPTEHAVIKKSVLMQLQHQTTPTLQKPVLLPRNNLKHCRNYLGRSPFLL